MGNIKEQSVFGNYDQRENLTTSLKSVLSLSSNW